MTKIIGIDPAPSKESTVFDGDVFMNLDYQKLQEYLNKLTKEHKDLLICWDAPLSFSIKGSSPFTKRKIEKFFSQASGCKTPEGISVLGYASCPHWMISQYLLGHPNLTSKPEPPFNLIFEKGNIVFPAVTEVHPAVAIWLWTKDKFRRKNWKYKDKNGNTFRHELVEALKSKGIIKEEIASQIKNDDYLDAYIAWKLGDAWINNQSVEILGNMDTGSFLLPYNEKVFKKFEEYCNEKKFISK